MQNDFDPTRPRLSEQIRIDLDAEESQFDFEVNEERTTNSVMTPGDYEFDAYIEEKELSELRKPKQQKEKVVYVNNPEDAAKIEALEKENKELK